MSDSDEDNYQLYGTLLEPYDEDDVPKKKAFSIEDQIATDDHGRRRFHGAFTGGFSAGFFNTVGSLEGWKPSEFKSSRAEKAEKKFQTPQDYMDDEDIGEFGIAPSVVRATNDYTNKVKRKRNMNTEGPIPGAPVLQTLLQPAKETVGIRLLKKMGWKPGQGVGPRITKLEKRKINREHKEQSGKVYGCEIPEEFRKQTQPDSESSEDDENDITFAPDDYDPYIYKPKDNSFGMGYSGLDRRAILSSHISLFDPPEFKMRDHKNNKVSISGQAFGVGAFEQEDEDIYTRDDMTKYDFELDSSFRKNKKTPKKIQEKLVEKMLEGFTIGTNSVSVKKSFPPPVLPKNFIPKHGVRMSRFEPLSESHKMFNYDRNRSRGRHDLSATERSKIINSEALVIKSNNTTKEIISTPFNFSQETEKKILKEKATKITTTLPNTNISLGSFKPFMTNPDKQKRYEEYLTLVKLGQEKQLYDIQPASMADWEKERERNEFAQAARMFKPVGGLVFDKFVSASTSDDQDPLKSVEKSIYQHGTKDMREAATKKMFGPLTRNIEIWKPNKLLCKRFNVPEPEISETELVLSRKKKNKFSVFDYYEAYKENTVIKEGPEVENETKTDATEQIKMEEEQNNSNVISEEISKDLSVPSTSTAESNIEKSLVLDYLVESSDSNLESNKNENTFLSNTNNTIPTFKTSRTIFLEESFNNFSNTSLPFKKHEEIKSTKFIEPTPVPIPTDPKEKRDLFKAIFLSSSESESEKSDHETEEIQENKVAEMKKIVLEENDLKKPSINIEPTKGIFSNLDWSKINRKTIISSTSASNKLESTSKEATVSREMDEDLYGPKLPTKKLPKNNTSDPVWKPKFTQTNSVTKPESSSSSEDVWMEVEEAKKSSKKHKKHKSKHKKCKSKHKKKKHSHK